MKCKKCMTAAILGQHCSFFYFGSGIILLHGTLGWVICKSMLGGSKKGDMAETVTHNVF